MRILVVYPYVTYPVDRGTFHRSFHLLREMARHHEVDLFALDEKGERLGHKPVFEKFCRRVAFEPFEHPEWPKLFPDRLMNPLPTTILHWRKDHIREALARFIEGQQYDMVHVCDIVMAQYFMEEHTHMKLVVDRSRVDLQFQLAQHEAMAQGIKQKLLDWENISKLERFEKRIAERAALEVLCGPDDEVFVRERISRDVPLLVIANGVDLEFFRPDSAPDPRDPDPTVLFCGAMDYTPNIDALRWFFGEMHDRLLAEVPGLRVWIVGKAPVDEVKAHGNRPGVTVTGGVPDVRPYYRRSWMQIVPLRIGGGTRLKIPECMAMRTPVISTTIGAQGLDLVHDQDILLADTPETFVREAARALKDAGLRRRLEDRGFTTVHERLGWGRLGGRLAEEYGRRFGGQAG